MPRGTSVLDEARLQGRLWTPERIQPLSWLDATDLSTLSIDGSGVTTWRDKSGRGNNASRATTSIVNGGIASSPGFDAIGINGRAAIDFTQDALVFPSGLLQNVSALTVVAILSTGGSFFSGALFAPYTTYNNSFEIDSALQASYPTYSSINGVAKFTTGLFRVDNVPSMMVYTADVSSTQAWANGSAVAALSATGISTISWGGVYSLGYVGFANNSFLDMKLGEFIVWNRSLQFAERLNLEGYLSHRWGIALNADHPFRNRPPLIGD